MMPEATFWKIVDTTRQEALARQRRPGQDVIDLHEQTLADALRKLPPDEVAAFDRRFWACHHQANRWDLWAVAYWMHGGCSDDGFTDFRACLISLGKTLFQQILADPDSVADIIGRPDIPYMQAEGFQYIAGKIYHELTGQPLPAHDGGGDDEPVGQRLDAEDEDVMQEHFPRLLAKLPEMGD